jgi:transposase-like protein
MGYTLGLMPWKEVTPMEEMMRFVSLVKTDRYTFTEVCEQFGVSRKTGYKHLARYEEEGLAGLAPRSHRPRDNVRIVAHIFWSR